jgi:hypothetical protein
LAHPISAQAQSASKVIERHINAIGGKTAVEKTITTDKHRAEYFKLMISLRRSAR